MYSTTDLGKYVLSEIGTGVANRRIMGILEPDQYGFSAFIWHSGSIAGGGERTRSASGGFNFTLDLAPLDTAPVPEPSTILLLGTGLAGVTARRWRH
jgi:hypothetical protein